MATLTRRYQFVGPSDDDLLRLVGALANRSAEFPLSIIDISVDDSVAGIFEQLDEYMTSRGWQYAPLSAPSVVEATSKLGYSIVTTIIEPVLWQIVDGVVTAPQFFSANLLSIAGRVVGQLRTIGAGAEFRIVEEKAGEPDVVMGLATAPDTAGTWVNFGVTTTTPPRTGQNTYTLQGRTNGVAVCELRYLTLSLLRSLQL